MNNVFPPAETRIIIGDNINHEQRIYFLCLLWMSMTFCTSSYEPMKIPDLSWIDSGTTSIIRSILLLTAWPPAVMTH